MQMLGTKNNVELTSRHSHSILKINTTIHCWLTVHNDTEEIYIYICIYLSIRESLQDLKVVHSRHKKSSSMKVYKIGGRSSSSSNLTMSS